MTLPTDAELVERFIRQRDAAALEELLRRYEEPLFRFLYGVLRDHHAAEDALQETFVQALRSLEGVRPEGIRSWLFTVAYQQAALWKRRRRNWPALLAEDVDLPAPAAPGEEMEQVEESLWVRQSLRLLPAVQQEALRARYYEGKKFREIAASLGCPLGTVLARLHAGLKKLRQMWEERYGR
jgi:RNA polymerase sigma-70 factor (ECF subfamily)